jgi:sulfite exporter TauE/SafE
MEWVWAGFGMGLLGSFHCAGMCGPIALSLPFSTNNQYSHLTGNVLYQLGRVTTYGIIGFIFGFIGRGFSLAGIQQPLSIGIGILMILLVLLPKLFNTHQSPSILKNVILGVKKSLAKYLHKRGYFALYTTGVLNGFLPCGLVYMALLGAIGIGSPMQSGLFMVFFGLGTFPMMFGIALTGKFISLKWRRLFNKAVPYFIVILGIIFILRGLGIGIKYLSPSDGALQIQQTEECH